MRPPKLFVPRPTTVTSGPSAPSVRVLMLGRYLRHGARKHDNQRPGRPRERDVELAPARVPALLGDQRRLDDDDAVELEALRLPRRQDRDGQLVERVPVRGAL